MAEVMKFEDFKECGNENAAKVCEIKDNKERISINILILG
jgi:hypothetical protein